MFTENSASTDMPGDAASATTDPESATKTSAEPTASTEAAEPKDDTGDPAGSSGQPRLATGSGQEAWELYLWSIAERDAETVCAFMSKDDSFPGCAQSMGTGLKYMSDTVVDAMQAAQVTGVVEADGLACLNMVDMMESNPALTSAFALLAGGDLEEEIQAGHTAQCMMMEDSHWVLTDDTPD